MSSYLSMFIKEMDCQLKSKDEAKNNFYSKQVFYKYLDSLKKEAEALEIIKKHYEVRECYKNQYIMTDGYGGSVELTKEEFNTLKEVLS